jgi:carbonic anhydrase
MKKKMHVIWSLLLCLTVLFAGTVGASEPTVEKPGPLKVLEMLEAGNLRYYSGKSTHPHTNAARIKLAGEADQGDYAYATIASCSDSRVPVELLFDSGIMDLFVLRVAGNVCDIDELGTIEYGLAHVKTPVFVLLGHTQCGAVTAVTHTVNGRGSKLERNIVPLIDNIIPAVHQAKKDYPHFLGDDIIPYAIEQNVWQGIEDLFMNSPVTREMVISGEAKVVGAIYDVGTGRVKWLSFEKVDEILQRVEESAKKETEGYAPQ